MITIFVLFALLGIGRVGAAEIYCVVCSEPDQTYRCSTGARGAGAAAEPSQLACVIQLAKRGGHKSCAVSRRPSAACDGIEAVIDGTETPPVGEEMALPSNGPPNTPLDAEAKAQSGDHGDEPGTLVELTKKAAETSGQAIKKAGGSVVEGTKKAGKSVVEGTKKVSGTVSKSVKDAGRAVGKATKSAFDCLVSLFQDCR